jgi:hypothetical protein
MTTSKCWSERAVRLAGRRGIILPRTRRAREEPTERDLLDEHIDIFAFKMNDMGQVKNETFQIFVTDDTPIFRRQYRLAEAEKEILKEQVEERLAVIREVASDNACKKGRDRKQGRKVSLRLSSI